MAETDTRDSNSRDTSSSATTTKQDRIYLKSGMGSVAAEDYDEKRDGKALKLSDEEYAARQRGVIPGVTIPVGAPLSTTPVGAAGAPGKLTTTIAGLHTYDPAENPTPTPVQPAAAPLTAAAVGKPVATIDENKDADKSAGTSAYTTASSSSDSKTAERR